MTEATRTVGAHLLAACVVYFRQAGLQTRRMLRFFMHLTSRRTPNVAGEEQQSLTADIELVHQGQDLMAVRKTRFGTSCARLTNDYHAAFRYSGVCGSPGIPTVRKFNGVVAEARRFIICTGLRMPLI